MAPARQSPASAPSRRRRRAHSELRRRRGSLSPAVDEVVGVLVRLLELAGALVGDLLRVLSAALAVGSGKVDWRIVGLPLVDSVDDFLGEVERFLEWVWHTVSPFL